MGVVPLACLLAAPAVHAFVQAPRLGATPTSRRAAVRLAEEGEGLTDAFKSFVEAAKPKKPGEGAATRTDVRGLPIRLGGETRDNSLGSLRAAAQNLEVLKDPRQWQAEEIGLLAALGSIFAAIVWGYFTYVAPPEAQAPPPSKAAVMRQQKLAECRGDDACEQRAIKDTQEAVDTQMQLDKCLNYAFSGTEKRMCQMNYGGKSFLGFF